MSDIPFPTPQHRVIASPQSHVKTIDSGGGTDFIFDEEVLFSNVQFIGEKAPGTNNTGNVDILIRKEDNTYVKWRTFTPGEKQNWPTPSDGAKFTKNSFKLTVTNANDGIRLLYS